MEKAGKNNKAISNQPIKIRYYSRHVLDLLLVDLPGLTKVFFYTILESCWRPTLRYRIESYRHSTLIHKKLKCPNIGSLKSS